MNQKYNELYAQIKKEFPKFEVIAKDSSKLMLFIEKIFLLKKWYPEFMEKYTTTMFGKVFMPRHLMSTGNGYIILRHELIHLRQARKYPLLFQFSYLFLLPAIFSMRAYWEFEAYCETLSALKEQQGYVLKTQIENLTKNFTGKYYLWMFPFKKTIEEKFHVYCMNKNIEVL